MIPKKNPNIDPKRNSFVYFSLGLFCMALLSYLAIESKTYERVVEGFASAIDDSFLDEDVPVTMPPDNPPPPPPPPPPAPEIIEIVDDKKDIVEDIIESTETNQKEEVVKPVEAKKVVVVEVEDDFDVPFAIIEDVPIFPGCEKEPKNKLKECFNLKMSQFIFKNQKYPEAAIDAGIQGKVFVNFVIEKDGSIVVSGMRSPDKILEKEAARVFSKMPKITPGKQRGKPVRVPYAIPITFKLQ